MVWTSVNVAAILHSILSETVPNSHLGTSEYCRLICKQRYGCLIYAYFIIRKSNSSTVESSLHNPRIEVRIAGGNYFPFSVSCIMNPLSSEKMPSLYTKRCFTAFQILWSRGSINKNGIHSPLLFYDTPAKPFSCDIDWSKYCIIHDVEKLQKQIFEDQLHERFPLPRPSSHLEIGKNEAYRGIWVFFYFIFYHEKAINSNTYQGSVDMVDGMCVLPFGS